MTKFRYYIVSEDYMVSGTNSPEVAAQLADGSVDVAIIDTEANLDLTYSESIEIPQQDFIPEAAIQQ